MLHLWVNERNVATDWVLSVIKIIANFKCNNGILYVIYESLYFRDTHWNIYGWNYICPGFASK